MVRSTSVSAYSGEAARTDTSSGAYGAAGLDVDLGPGALAVELGYEWSWTENEDLRVTAGGLLGALGYRFRL